LFTTGTASGLCNEEGDEVGWLHTNTDSKEFFDKSRGWMAAVSHPSFSEALSIKTNCV
jgi:hypothetical protein